MDLLEQYNQGNHFGKANNLKLKIISEGQIEYSMQLEDKHLAVKDLIHGGAISGFMDAILSVAAFSAVYKKNKKVATVEFKINYLKPVRKLQILTGKGSVLKKGSKLLFVQGEIFDEANELITTGSGTIMQFDGKN